MASRDTRSDYLLLYGEEAHAVDEWPISSGRYNPGGEPVSVKQPRDLGERIAVCGEMLEKLGLEGGGGFQVALDDPAGGNAFGEAYSPWPIRMYVVEGGVLQFISEPRGCSHDVGELREWLEGRHGEDFV
ncbi:hypothetical protein TeGR_g12658 [Tetraparma gracilis]|uniref:Iodothyronine deiodinase n=1 Tax=Tetraparma gracilis TaxID=2962635 RepID=A0ABQ6NAH1_9STRA|nr:hypothetical protein TeGR_g12658 [Tetraparma gracilis]